MSVQEVVSKSKGSVELGAKEKGKEVKDKKKAGTNDFDDQAVGEDIKNRAAKTRVPKCCGCCNMVLASISLGIFYLLPIALFIRLARSLWAMHPLIMSVFALIALCCGITACVCFYNAYSPEVWICDWISWLQMRISFALFALAVPMFIVAGLQCINWSYDASVEKLFDDFFEYEMERIRKGGDEEAEKGWFYKWCAKVKGDGESAGKLLAIFGILPIAFGLIGVGISLDFDHMAKFVFNIKLVEEYEKLKEYDQAIEDFDKKVEKVQENSISKSDHMNDDLQVNVNLDQFKQDYDDPSTEVPEQAPDAYEVAFGDDN